MWKGLMALICRQPAYVGEWIFLEICETVYFVVVSSGSLIRVDYSDGIAVQQLWCHALRTM